MKNLAFALALVSALPALALDLKIEHGDRNSVADILPFDDGTFTVTLSTQDEKAPDPLVIAKLDANGKEFWSTTLLDLNPRAGCTVRTPEGNYVVVGTMPNTSDLKLASFDAEGELLWHSRFPEAGMSSSERPLVPVRLVQTAKNELVLMYTSGSSTKQSVILRKLDEKGKFSAVLARFEHSVTSLSVGEAGELLLAGAKDGKPWFTRVSKDDPSKILWTADTLDGAGSVADVVKTADGSAALTGVLERRLLSRYSTNGKLKWQKFLEKELRANQLRTTPDGGFVTVAHDGDWKSIVLAKFTATGRMEWKAKVPTPSGFRYVSDAKVFPLKDGSFLVSGFLEREKGIKPAWIFSVDASGKVGN